MREIRQANFDNLAQAINDTSTLIEEIGRLRKHTELRVGLQRIADWANALSFVLHDEVTETVVTGIRQ